MCSRTPTSTLFVPIVLGEQNILICVLSQHPSPITFLRCSSHTATPLPGSSAVPNQCHGPTLLPKSKASGAVGSGCSPSHPLTNQVCAWGSPSVPISDHKQTREDEDKNMMQPRNPGAEAPAQAWSCSQGGCARNSPEWQKAEDGRETGLSLTCLLLSSRITHMNTSEGLKLEPRRTLWGLPGRNPPPFPPPASCVYRNYSLRGLPWVPKRKFNQRSEELQTEWEGKKR